jgi:hypothetical protein
MYKSPKVEVKPGLMMISDETSFGVIVPNPTVIV